MKFVFITSRSLDRIGGIESYMSHICQSLSSKGHKVVLYVFGEGPKRKTILGGIEIINIPSFPHKVFEKMIVSLKATIHLLRFHRDADIIHYNAMAAGVFSWIPILFKKKVVFQGHGFEWQRAKWSNFAKKIIKMIDSFCLRTNHNIIMVSEDQSKYVRNKFHKRAVTITPGVSLDNIYRESDILQKHSLCKNDYFLFLGRLVPEKKPDVLIEAFLKSDSGRRKLVIAGDDPFAKAYIRKLKQYQGANVIFTGAVYGDDKETLLEHCLAFCIPSELEGLPITLLEAMSHKKICIASDIPANQEALAENGVFFRCNCVDSLRDQLELVSNNPAIYLEKAERNYDRVLNRFTWDRISEEYENYCKDVINA